MHAGLRTRDKVSQIQENRMKRLHVSLAVKDLAESVRFYSTLFATKPTVLKTDYAKWMLDDPRVNFSISARGEDRGFDHLGIQVESQNELVEIASRLEDAGAGVYDKGEAHCCYAHSHKAWVRDPEGLPWETFFTFGTDTAYGEGIVEKVASAPTCCADSSCGRQEPEVANSTAASCCS
jgi:catechol 2,3-dioxygenase-like lactoylglutathione lyase family enzyme